MKTVIDSSSSSVNNDDNGNDDDNESRSEEYSGESPVMTSDESSPQWRSQSEVLNSGMRIAGNCSSFIALSCSVTGGERRERERDFVGWKALQLVSL